MSCEEFEAVGKHGGELVERIDQRSAFGDRDAGRMCVPLSILWQRFRLNPYYRQTPFWDYIAPPIGGASPESRRLGGWIRVWVQHILDEMTREVDDPLAVWEKSGAFRLDQVRQWIVGQRRVREELPPWVSDTLMAVLATCQLAPPVWPPALEEVLNEAWSAKLKSLIDSAPPRVPPWKELMEYRFLDDLVIRLYSHAKLSRCTHADYHSPLDAVGDLRRDDGFALFVLFRLTRVTADEEEVADVKGHMMAMQFEGEGITLFDPNCGVASFKKQSDFTAWFRTYLKGKYQAWLDAGFVKRFERLA